MERLTIPVLEEAFAFAEIAPMEHMSGKFSEDGYMCGCCVAAIYCKLMNLKGSDMEMNKFQRGPIHMYVHQVIDKVTTIYDRNYLLAFMIGFDGDVSLSDGAQREGVVDGCYDGLAARKHFLKM